MHLISLWWNAIMYPHKLIKRLNKTTNTILFLSLISLTSNYDLKKQIKLLKAKPRLHFDPQIYFKESQWPLVFKVRVNTVSSDLHIYCWSRFHQNLIYTARECWNVTHTDHVAQLFIILKGWKPWTSQFNFKNIKEISKNAQ